MHLPSLARRHYLKGLLMVASFAAGWLLLRAPYVPPTPAEPSRPAGPPWLYGHTDARFTVVLYADLECPHCQSYTPKLRNWIDTQPDVNLQWHHLPLPMHEPAAEESARWAECMGATFGHERFWYAVSWVYQHTRGNGQGLPPSIQYPEQSNTVRSCLSSDRPGAVVRDQAEQARQAGVTATPTLQLIDNTSNRRMTLTGTIEGDALLSALDFLTSPDISTTASELSAGTAGDMPR